MNYPDLTCEVEVGASCDETEGDSSLAKVEEKQRQWKQLREQNYKNGKVLH